MTFEGRRLPSPHGHSSYLTIDNAADLAIHEDNRRARRGRRQRRAVRALMDDMLETM